MAAASWPAMRRLGEYLFRADGEGELLFTHNESNAPLLWGAEAPGPFKDAFHEFLINGRRDAVHPERMGTKAAAHRLVQVEPGAQAVVRVRLSAGGLPENRFDEVLRLRRLEADAFYRDLQHEVEDPDARLVQRQAFAGMVWSQQFFYLDMPQWLHGDPAGPPPPEPRKRGRNAEWAHLNNADVISMPDKWEYPWYAAWDLGFHAVALAAMDPEFAKEQLVLITREWYMHPNGQLPAYEWAFGDVNPPVHGWAAWRVFQIDRKHRRRAHPDDPGDLAFLERVFHKLMLNFTWWVNRKDSEGRNIFQGGFLGLDNIGVFDRSAPLPALGRINQSDCTGWMAMYCLNLMRMALELALHNHVYEDIATKFFEHFLQIAGAMTRAGGQDHGLWDDQDGFFYDVLEQPGQPMIPLRVRSMVGLIPLFAVETLEPALLDKVPGFKGRLEWFLELPPRPRGPGLALAGAGPGRTPAAVPAARQPHEETAPAHAGRKRIPVGLRGARPVPLPPGTPLHLPLERPRDAGELQPRRIGLRGVRRQFQLARTRLVPGQLPDHRIPAEVPPLLRGRFPHRVPHRLRTVPDHRRGGR